LYGRQTTLRLRSSGTAPGSSPPPWTSRSAVAVVADPFDNVLVLVDLSKGTYGTDDHGHVTSVA